MIIKYGNNLTYQNKHNSSTKVVTSPDIDETSKFDTEARLLVKDKRQINFNIGNPKTIFSTGSSRVFSNIYGGLVKQIFNELDNLYQFPDSSGYDDLLEEEEFNMLNNNVNFQIVKDCDNPNHKSGLVIESIDENGNIVSEWNIGECGCYTNVLNISILSLLPFLRYGKLFKARRTLGISALKKRLTKLLEDLAKLQKGFDRNLKLRTIYTQGKQLKDDILSITEELMSYTNQPLTPFDKARLDRLGRLLRVKQGALGSLLSNNNLQSNIDFTLSLQETNAKLDKYWESIEPLLNEKVRIDKCLANWNEELVNEFFPGFLESTASILSGLDLVVPKVCGPEGVPFRRVVDQDNQDYAQLDPETCECSICPEDKFLCKSRNPYGQFPKYLIGVDIEDALSYCMDGCCGGSIRYYDTFTDSCGCACGDDITTGEILQGGSDPLSPVDGVFMPCATNECKNIDGYYDPTRTGWGGKCVSKALIEENRAKGIEWNSQLCDFENSESSSSSSSSSSDESTSSVSSTT